MSAIISVVWSLVGPTIVNLAINTGLPAAMQWLMSKGLPSWLTEGLTKIIKDALGQIGQIKSDPTLTPAMQREGIRNVKAVAKSAVKAHVKAGKKALGTVGNAPELK